MQNIDCAEAKRLIDNNEAELIDVREPAEYRQCHIPSAHLRPLSKLALTDIDLDNKKIIVHCQKGMRGQKACQLLIEKHSQFTFYNLQGGIEAWQSAGLPVNENTNSKLLALDRQVQITIGFAVLSGVILSQTVDPNFIWISGFFGAGLLFAGLSGFCGLARVLALMPWNK